MKTLNYVLAAVVVLLLIRKCECVSVSMSFPE